VRSPTRPSATRRARTRGRVEAAVEADLERHAGLLDAPQRAVDLARSSETGFSQKIALPARAAATIRSACVSVLVQMATASTSAAAAARPARRPRARRARPDAARALDVAS
jgi:hypothetical protein